ncbi:MAG: hypothetical protein ABSA76_14270 [Bacteroidales bacterium]
MKPNRLSSPRHLAIVFASFISFFLLSSATLKAQAPVNFSGKWAYDKSKSNTDKGSLFTEGDEILVITQDATSISVERTLIRPGSDNLTSTDKFNLEGKEIIEKSDTETTKRTAKWSADKNVLTLTTIITFDPSVSTVEYRTDDNYKLTDNGKLLTLESISKSPSGEGKTVQFWNKK